MSKTYKDVIDQKNNEKLLELIAPLPRYVRNYFNHIHNFASRTKISYAYNIRHFLEWIKTTSPDLREMLLTDITLDILNALQLADIDEYLAYLETINANAGIAQKISCLNSFFKYLYDDHQIEKNPVANVNRNAVEPKPIIKLSQEQTETLLNTIEYGWSNMTERQKTFWKRDKTRDLTLIMLMLSTGIRVSECVGLDISDVSIKDCCIMIVRKGHKEKQIIYFNDELADVLADYLLYRESIIPCKNSESALFLSAQKSRLGVQSIEDIVKKYTKAAGFGNIYTPHKLRKTYGTELYNGTRDIYLVANALGHKDVATTTKHYVEDDSVILQQSRNKIKLRLDTIISPPQETSSPE